MAYIPPFSQLLHDELQSIDDEYDRATWDSTALTYISRGSGNTFVVRGPEPEESFAWWFQFDVLASEDGVRVWVIVGLLGFFLAVW